MIDHDRGRTDDDEAGYRLGTHTLRIGEYVSIRDANGDLNTFKGADLQSVGVKLVKARAMRCSLFVLMLIALSQPAVAQSGRAQRGFTFAQSNCAGCHAVGRFDDSPLPIAPPFRTLHTRYPVENLAEALAEGITTGHPSMPEFRLDPAEINDLIAYLKTLER